MKKRILCILLALSLCAAQLPLAASAQFGDNPDHVFQDATPPSSNDPKANPNYDNTLRNVQGLNGLQASQHGTRLDFFVQNMNRILDSLRDGENVIISMPGGTTIDAFALFLDPDVDLDGLADATGNLFFQFPDGSSITISAEDLADTLGKMEAGDKLAFSSTQPYVYILKPNNTKEVIEAGQRQSPAGPSLNEDADDSDVMSSLISIGPSGTSNSPSTPPQAEPGEEVTVNSDVINEVDVPVGMEIVNITENAEAVFVSRGNKNTSLTLDPGDSVEIQVTFTPDVDEDYGFFPVSVQVQCWTGDNTALKNNEYFNFNFQVVPTSNVQQISPPPIPFQ